LEVGIPVGVVEMVMRIDDEAHRLVGYSFERGLDLVGERGELVIDQDDAVVACREGDIAARTLQQINIAADLADLDLYFAEVIFAHIYSPDHEEYSDPRKEGFQNIGNRANA